jgi:transcriptional regulator with XRE-family HTH domain
MASRAVSEDSKKIGLLMRRIITDNELTQEQTAFRLGLSSATVLNYYLLGKRELPLEVIKKFSKEFNIPISVLMRDEEYKPNTDIDLEKKDELLEIIIKVSEKFMLENDVTMTPEDKARVFAQIYKMKCAEEVAIKAVLFGMQLAKSEIFIKNNR